jgi:hypothetical protein
MNPSRLENALARFEKSVNISFAGPTPTSLLARQDLEAALVVLSDRQTPFRDRVTRIKGEGLAHLWNQRTRLDNAGDGPSGLVQLFYADGNLPNTTDPNYVQKTAAYVYLGTTAVITGPMINFLSSLKYAVSVKLPTLFKQWTIPSQSNAFALASA